MVVTSSWGRRDGGISGFFVCLFCFVFGHVAQLAGSQFPDQGLNLGHGGESAKS